MNPRLITRILGAFLLLMSLHTPAAAQEITNIQAAQRPGTNLVDIDYDLTGIAIPVRITLEVSDDDGLTWDVPGITLSGDAGYDVAPATGLRLTWDAGRDWGGRVSDTMRYKVIADPFPPPVGFARIPAGEFTMGRTSGDTDSNAPPVNVYVSEFYMATHEVTWELWTEVRTWGIDNGYTDIDAGGGKAADHPVHSVNWWDVVKWCNARSEKDGLTPVYTVGGEVMRTGTTEPDANWNANGYRLPTEAEWEKAARGGVAGQRFPWGDEINHDHANYRANGSAYTYDTSPYTTLTFHPTYNHGTTPYTSPVGSFAPNGFGLYDMAGNVWEWNWDWYAASTYTEGASDPKGAASGSYRVLRGGSWGGLAFFCRSASRNNRGNPGDPGRRRNDRGFRPARSTHPLNLAEYQATHESGQYNLQINIPGSWTAESDQDWVTVTPSSGRFPATVTISYQSHDEGSFPRTATLTIGGLTHTITQQPAPNEIGTLELIAGGTLNGGEIDAGNRALTVETGAPITGQVRVRADNRMPTGAVTPLGGTAVWGERTTAFWMTQSNFATGIEEFDMPIDLTAPDEPGTYHIVLAFEGEFTMEQIMSRTNWTASDVVWNNGIDAGFDWTPEQFDAASTLGAVRGKLLTGSGMINRWMPATVIEVVVQEPFYDDFESGLVRWNSFGVPAPVVVAAQGRDAVLDVNGDSSWNSGVWTIQEIELRVGTVISFDVFLDVTNPAGCWVDIACGITNGQPSGQPEGQMSVHQLGRFHFEGDACWATPEEFRPHAYMSSFGLPLEQARMADAYLGAWQTMTLEVLEDFRIRATLGGDLVSESPNPVDPDFRAGHLQIYGRSSGSAGKAYVDNVMVNSGGDGPTPPEGFALIPAGSFTMGRTSGDTDTNAPPVNVHVSEFYMATHEVTWELWTEVRTWGIDNGYTDIAAGGGKAADHPVHSVNWWDVVKWCNARSEMDGLTPVYRNADDTVFKTGTVAPNANWSANGYRLPTEAEWEKAARGGVSGQRFPWGDTINHTHANYRANGSAYTYDTSPYTTWTYHPTYNDGTMPYTSPVGSFAPNGYGLYDMAGNVWEWNWDWYSASTYTEGASDPKGAASGSSRVLRGGGWSGDAFFCRSAFRNFHSPGYRRINLGFRLARSSVP